MLFRAISILVHLCSLSLVYAAPLSSTDIRVATLPISNDSQTPESGLTIGPGTMGLHLEPRSQERPTKPPKYIVWFRGESAPERPRTGSVPEFVRKVIEDQLTAGPNDVGYYQDLPEDHIRRARLKYYVEDTANRVIHWMESRV
ncbi:hypothetical protein EV360DRAFT_72514 [Lentinula raphanica]|nr:hypothetical protein EV360DRAFT_72514 [Lentinula raphanica]